MKKQTELKPAHTLRADFEIVETGEKFTLDGFDIKTMIEKARKEAGEWVTIAIRTIAVLSVILCSGCATTDGLKSRHTVEPGPWGREDITTAPQTRAPLSYDEGYKQLNVREG